MFLVDISSICPVYNQSLTHTILIAKKPLEENISKKADSQECYRDVQNTFECVQSSSRNTRLNSDVIYDSLSSRFVTISL